MAYTAQSYKQGSTEPPGCENPAEVSGVKGCEMLSAGFTDKIQ